MRKNAFTLIELLAVIVILAIIALIAVPIVIHIIDDTKTSSEKESVELYIDSVKKTVARKQLEKNNFNPATCEIKEDGNLLCDDVEVIVDMKGTKAINGIIEFSNGKIVEESTWLEMPNNNYYKYDNNIIIKLTEDEIKRLNSRLPKEYQEVEYIESTGTQYIDTGMIANQDIITKAIFENTNSTIYTNTYIIGAMIEWPQKMYAITPYVIFAYGSQYKINTSLRIKNIKFTAILNKNQYEFLSEEETIMTGTLSNSEFSPNLSLYIFANHTSEGVQEYYAGRIFNITLMENDENLRNFIPCYSKTTVIDVDGIERPKGTVGMYDLVEGKFYTNQGTGEFIKGPDV